MVSEIKQRTVYKLVRTDKPEDGTDVYVGSTSQSLEKRLRQHRYNATLKKECKYDELCNRMCEIGPQNWKIISLLSQTCDEKTIRELELIWCEKMNPDLNTYTSINLPDEWEKKEVISKYQADHYKANKEIILKREANYYKANKEIISKRKADYYKVNKEIISKRGADYRESVIESKKYYCEICEKAFCHSGNLQQHLKSEKHFWKYIYSVD